MKSIVRISTLLSCLLLTGLSAIAQNPVTPALGFNLFAQNNTTVLSSHAEGAAAIGGDLTITGQGWGVCNNTAGTFQVSGLTVGLVVGGKVNYNGGNSFSVLQNAYVKIGIQNGSTAWYVDQNQATSPIRITPNNNYNATPRIELNGNANTFGGQTYLQNSNQIFQANVIDFTAKFALLNSNASTMAGMGNNVTLKDNSTQTVYTQAQYPNIPNNMQARVVMGSGTNVLTIAGSDLNKFSEIGYTISPNANNVIIINVNATGSFTWNVPNTVSLTTATHGPYIIYNFYNATSVTVSGNGSVTGTIFAPGADVYKSSNSNIDGQVICKSYTMNSGSGGELHPVYFNGSVLSTNTAPSITTHPSSYAICSGASQQLTSAATGTPTPTVQWQYNSGSGWTNFSGATTSNYTFSPSVTTQYQAVYTNTAGSATTNTATITVNTAPTVSTHPTGGTSCTSVAMNAAANGTTPMTIQWKKQNGVNWDVISGATNASYSATASGVYKAFFSNSCQNDVATNAATVTISSAVAITTHPSSTPMICPSNANTTFSSAATGYTSVQWQLNTGSGWNDISGATNTSFTLAGTTISQLNYQYRAVYTGTCGTQTTNAATLNLYSPAAIAANPSNETAAIGATVTFYSAATGNPTPTVQWYRNTGSGYNSIPGATNTSYSFTVQSGDAGQYRAEYTNLCAIAITVPATLTLGSAPTITTPPSNQTVCDGATASFTASATGSPSPTVQWEVNTGSGWNAISGATNTTYSFTASLANSTNQYRAVFTNIHGSTNTTAATLTVNPVVVPAVSIASNTSGTICGNVPVTFTATPTNGGASPSYQWTLNGNNVGSNSATYNNNSWNNGDQVSVVMTSNASCAAPATASPVAPITMSINPAAAQPGAFTASAGTLYWGQVNATYTVPSVSGVTYNWSYSGTGLTITGTGNSITINVAQAATSGTLSVTATNGCGVSVARTINITVLPYITWLCTNGTNWNDAANWDSQFVPYGTINVLIPASAPCEPTLPSSFEVRDLKVEPGAEINIPAGDELTVHGNLDNDGTICSGVVVMNATVAQIVGGNGIICNLELDNPNGGTIPAGDSIHIREHYTPNTGTLTTNGGLVLLSDSTHGTATILAPVNGNCFNYISGNVVINKWIHGGRRAFRFLAHPFSHSVGLNQLTDDFDITGDGGSANGFTTTATNNPSAFWYNTLTGNGSTVNDATGWKAYSHTNGIDSNAWNKMQGARILIRGTLGQGVGCEPCVPSAVGYDMTGLVNMCDVTLNLQTNANAGYNFVGNPYAANVQMSTITRGSAIGANFSVWDPNQGIYGAYVTQPFAAPYVLSAYSSFIVTNTSNTNNSITFHESDKTANAASGNLFKTTGSSFGANSLQLTITSNNDSVNWDRLLVFMDGSANTDYDANDARKLSNISLDFYSKATDNSNLSVDFRPMAVGDKIELGLRADTLQTYSIHVADYDAPAGIQLYLKDKFLNTMEPMSQGMKYTFDVNSNPLSQGENRFEIVAGSTTSVGNTPVSGIEVAMTPNPARDIVTISLGGVKGTSMVTMTSLMGQVVYSNTVNGTGSINIPVSDMANGVYIVTVKNGSNSVTHKLVKQ